MNFNLQKIRAVDILKEKNININAAVKKLKKNDCSLQLIDEILYTHNIAVNKITDIEIILILCDFYNIYSYKNNFYLELNQNGYNFKQIVQNFININNNELLKNIDNLNDIKSKLFNIIKLIIEKVYTINL